MRVIEQPWDTEAFGYKAGALVIDGDYRGVSRAEITSTMKIVLEQQFVFVSCRLPIAAMSVIHSLEDQGFRFIEMTLNTRLKSAENSRCDFASGISAGRATKADSEAIVNAVPGIYEHGRFHVDPRVPRGDGDRRYQSWILNSTSSGQADLLSVKGADGQIQAFFLSQLDSVGGSATWLLNGMMPEFKGHGLAKQAWSAAIRHHFSSGGSEIKTTISSANLAALTLYSRLGFSFTQAAATLHWLRPR